jgi:hypothetical protein
VGEGGATKTVVTVWIALPGIAGIARDKNEAARAIAQGEDEGPVDDHAICASCSRALDVPNSCMGARRFDTTLAIVLKGI